MIWDAEQIVDFFTFVNEKAKLCFRDQTSQRVLLIGLDIDCTEKLVDFISISSFVLLRDMPSWVIPVPFTMKANSRTYCNSRHLSSRMIFGQFYSRHHSTNILYSEKCRHSKRCPTWSAAFTVALQRNNFLRLSNL